ncbi:MAG TPA: hypothetical protein VNR37_03305 [Microbacteriaceae bacterium]|nr:hypothetical protein [Microbacteriaceae bacterium]
MTATVIPFIPRPVMESGREGCGPRVLPDGWARVSTVVRYGDDKDAVYWHGPVVARTPDAITLTIYGEDVTFPLEQRALVNGCDMPVRPGWVVSE